MPVLTCSRPGVGRGDPTGGVLVSAKTSAAMKVNRCSLVKLFWPWPTSREWRSLLPTVKQQARAAVGRSGVRSGGGRRKLCQELGSPREASSPVARRIDAADELNAGRESITGHAALMGSRRGS